MTLRLRLIVSLLLSAGGALSLFGPSAVASNQAIEVASAQTASLMGRVSHRMAVQAQIAQHWSAVNTILFRVAAVAEAVQPSRILEASSANASLPGNSATDATEYATRLITWRLLNIISASIDQVDVSLQAAEQAARHHLLQVDVLIASGEGPEEFEPQHPIRVQHQNGQALVQAAFERMRGAIGRARAELAPYLALKDRIPEALYRAEAEQFRNRILAEFQFIGRRQVYTQMLESLRRGIRTAIFAEDFEEAAEQLEGLRFLLSIAAADLAGRSSNAASQLEARQLTAEMGTAYRSLYLELFEARQALLQSPVEPNRQPKRISKRQDSDGGGGDGESGGSHEHNTSGAEIEFGRSAVDSGEMPDPSDHGSSGTESQRNNQNLDFDMRSGGWNSDSLASRIPENIEHSQSQVESDLREGAPPPESENQNRSSREPNLRDPGTRGSGHGRTPPSRDLQRLRELQQQLDNVRARVREEEQRTTGAMSTNAAQTAESAGRLNASIDRYLNQTMSQLGGTVTDALRTTQAWCDRLLSGLPAPARFAVDVGVGIVGGVPLDVADLISGMLTGNSLTGGEMGSLGMGLTAAGVLLSVNPVSTPLGPTYRSITRALRGFSPNSPQVRGVLALISRHPPNRVLNVARALRSMPLVRSPEAIAEVARVSEALIPFLRSRGTLNQLRVRPGRGSDPGIVIIGRGMEHIRALRDQIAQAHPNVRVRIFDSSDSALSPAARAAIEDFYSPANRARFPGGVIPNREVVAGSAYGANSTFMEEALQRGDTIIDGGNLSHAVDYSPPYGMEQNRVWGTPLPPNHAQKLFERLFPE